MGRSHQQSGQTAPEFTVSTSSLQQNAERRNFAVGLLHVGLGK